MPGPRYHAVCQCEQCQGWFEPEIAGTTPRFCPACEDCNEWQDQEAEFELGGEG
jgi:hypothetical protein